MRVPALMLPVLIQRPCIHVSICKHLLFNMTSNNGTDDSSDEDDNAFKPHYGLLALIAFALAILALVFLVFAG